MKLGGDLEETATNISLESQRDRNEIVDSSHLRQTLHWKEQQKSHQKSHV